MSDCAERFAVLLSNGQWYSDWNVYGCVLATRDEYDVIVSHMPDLPEFVRAWVEVGEKWSAYEHEIEVFNLFLDSIGVAARAMPFDEDIPAAALND